MFTKQKFSKSSSKDVSHLYSRNPLALETKNQFFQRFLSLPDLAEHDTNKRKLMATRRWTDAKIKSLVSITLANNDEYLIQEEDNLARKDTFGLPNFMKFDHQKLTDAYFQMIYTYGKR